MTILEVKGVSKTYQLGRVLVPALHEVTFQVNSQEFVCIMGPSGSGKTTLLNLIDLINEPSQGYIPLKGQRSSH